MSSRAPSDEAWMRRAIALAARGEGGTRPNPPVGAVVVRHGRCVGEGWHRRAGGPHAEIHALEQAGARARGATLYVSLEPCCTWGRTGPCTEAIARSGVSRVVAAGRDPNPRHHGKGLAAIRKHGIRAEVGVCGDEAAALIEPFGKRILTGYPFVTLKLACSLDGRIADVRGRSRWISGPAARRWVRNLRKCVDAVLVGAGTARTDDPGLLAFDRGAPRGYRVIMSSNGDLPRSLRALSDQHAGRTIVAVSRKCPPSAALRLASGGATVWMLPSTRDGRVSVRALLRRLGKAGFLHVLCEGGGELAEALVDAGMVDRYRFVFAGRLIGGRGRAAVGGAGWRLAAAPNLRIVSVERLGSDVLLTAEPAGVRQRRGKGAANSCLRG